MWSLNVGLWLSFTVTDDYSDSESEAEERFRGTAYILTLFFVIAILYATFNGVVFCGSSLLTAAAEQGEGQLQLHQDQKHTCEKGSPPAQAFWVLPGRVAAEVKGWRPVPAGGHAAVSP